MIAKKIKQLLLIVLILFAGRSFLQAQSLGIPFIKSYSSVEYNFHPKNFSVIQDDRGVMYFGNAYGVLEFDGSTWKTIDLPQGKSAVSFTKDDNGKIYVGSVDEVGFLSADSKGRTLYKSILNQLALNDKNFGEVRKSFFWESKLVLSSFSQITILDGEKVNFFRPLNPNMAYDFAGEVEGQIYLRESGRGLLKLTNDALLLVEEGEFFLDKIVYAILPFAKDELLIVSSEGLLIYNGATLRPLSSFLNQFVKQNFITCGISLPNDQYAISTLNKGVVIFDRYGNVTQLLNKKNGLAGDDIYSLYLDTEDNLWIATDNGINHVYISNPFTSINEDAGLSGMGYAACTYGDKIYLGTSQGLFVKKWTKGSATHYGQLEMFKRVENIEGQVWTLDVIEGVLLCGHNKGLFIVDKDIGYKISPGDYTGRWTFKSFRNGTYLLVGTYNGLELYEKSNNTWVFKNLIKGFSESSRTLEIDKEENIWVCHGNNGLFRIKLNEGLDSVAEVINMSQAHHFPSDYFNDIAWIDNHLVFAGEKNLYRYNQPLNRFERIDYLNSLLEKDILISRVKQMEDGNIWLVNRDVIEILVKQIHGGFSKSINPFRKLKGQIIGSYEFFRMFNDKNYFIGTRKGFVHFDPSNFKKNKSFTSLIRKVESISEKDSLLFDGTFLNKKLLTVVFQPETSKIHIPYSANSLRFTYSALYYEDHENNQYQYYLQKGSDAKEIKWSGWTNATYKEYTNLREGDYTFCVRAKNIYDQTSHVASFSFSIAPPWYRTKIAYASYFFSGLLFAMMLIKIALIKINNEKLRLKKEKEKELLLLEKQYSEEVLKAEREIILLQKEKLESEVRYKNDELASLATNLSQKTEFLGQLKRTLVAISHDIKPGNQALLTKVIKNIDKGIEFNDSWEHFQANFDNVHHNFLCKLRDKFPFLKPPDLLLCAYIRMNKSNKEISSLLNISVSAVEKRRFRLREKLTLDNDTKLTEFLLGI